MTDTTAPTPPTLEQALVLSPTDVALTWLPGTDAVGVTTSKVYRDGALLATLSDARCNYLDGSAVADTSYYYQVTSLDAALNESEKSGKQTVRTRPSSAVSAVSSSAGSGRTEIDFGSTPVASGTFTITDGRVTPSSKIIAQIAYEAATDRDLDEVEMDDLLLRCGPATGSFTLLARSFDGSYLEGKYHVFYMVSN